MQTMRTRPPTDGGGSNMTRRRSAFFLAYSVLLFLAAFGGFALNGALRPASLPAPTPLLIAHGLLMVAWFLVLILQTALVRLNRVQLHRRLGMGSLVIAVGVVVAAVLVALGAYRPGSGESMLLPNVVMLINFTGLYAQGLRTRRRDREAHKRWMVLAGAALLGPSLGRICLATGAPMPLMLALWLGLLAPLWVHDWRRPAHRVHRATAIGSSCILLGVVVASALSMMAPVQAFLDGLLG